MSNPNLGPAAHCLTPTPSHSNRSTLPLSLCLSLPSLCYLGQWTVTVIIYLYYIDDSDSDYLSYNPRFSPLPPLVPCLCLSRLVKSMDGKVRDMNLKDNVLAMCKVSLSVCLSASMNSVDRWQRTHFPLPPSIPPSLHPSIHPEP